MHKAILNQSRSQVAQSGPFRSSGPEIVVEKSRRVIPCSDKGVCCGLLETILPSFALSLSFSPQSGSSLPGPTTGQSIIIMGSEAMLPEIVVGIDFGMTWYKNPRPPARHEWY